MADRRIANPKILLAVAALAGLIFSAIAIFIAAGYTPESREHPGTPVTVTSTPPHVAAS